MVPYSIQAATMVLSSGDGAAELIVQNATRNVLGPLMNTGNGQTAFKLLVPGDIPALSTDKLADGVLPVARGGTGLGVLGSPGESVRVNAAGNGLEYYDPDTGGTVTSVGILLPTNIFTNGTAVTTAGDLTATLNNQAANSFLGGPTSGGTGTPDFRTLLPADIPGLDAAKIISGTLPFTRGGTGLNTLGGPLYQLRVNAGGTALEYFAPAETPGTVTSVGLQLPTDVFTNGPDVTTAGDLTATLNAQAANSFLGGPTSGAPGVPAFRILLPSDIPDLSAIYILVSQKGVSGGVATLGMDGKVPSSQLPVTGSLYQGTWDASTNTPTISDGIGTAGWYYRVTVAGTQDLGSGNITFSVGDDVIYNGTIWQRVPGGDAVNSVNGYTGDVVLVKGDIGLGNVDNTSDLNKPISLATQGSLDLKADKAILLIAGEGLDGGGDLTANRTFVVLYGTTAGTAAQGNDSRINNGQTAFGWGNHALAGYLTATTGDARYPQLSGSYANPSWLAWLAWSKITGAPSSFPTSSDLAAVLLNGNSANNSITLGGAGVTTNQIFRMIRNVASVDYTGVFMVSGSPGTAGAALTSSDGTNNRILYLPAVTTEPRYSPDGGSSSVKMWHETNHPAGTTGSITYTGAEVPASFSFNSAGHYTASGKRTLTAGDIDATPEAPSASSWSSWVGVAQGRFIASTVGGPNSNTWYGLHMPGDANNGAQLAFRGSGSVYFRTQIGGVVDAWTPLVTQAWATSNFAPSSGSGNYIQANPATPQGVYSNVSLYQKIQKDGSNSLSASLILQDAANAKGVNLQLNGDANPGLAFWLHNGVSWIKRFELASGGLATFYSSVTMDNPSSTLTVAGNITTPLLQSPANSDLIAAVPSGQSLKFTTGVTTRGTWDSDGRLGIGTTPNSIRASLLEVAGNVWSTDAYLLGTGSTPVMEVYQHGSDGGVRMMNSTAKMTFDVGTTGSVHAMQILPDGKIGIGNITPTSTVHINGSFATETRIINSATAFSVLSTDHTLLFQGFSTGTGTSITLPDPATCDGRILTFIENTASNWTTNESISRTDGPPLTAISGTMTIQAIGGTWWLINRI